MSGWFWIDYDEVESTNDEAKKMSANPQSEKFVITAQSQTKGRGRRGRSWIGLQGNLFMSLGFKIPLVDLGVINLITSLSLLESIKAYAPDLDVKLKWPNDVLVCGAKISGILMESGEGDYLIIGIGVNIANHPTDSDLLYKATSLHEVGITTTRIEFLERFIETFDTNLQIWQQNGFNAIKDKWLTQVKGLHEEIVVKQDNQELRGVFSGIDNMGSLILDTGKELKKIYAGDVFYMDK